jgi:hypothetical protein
MRDDVKCKNNPKEKITTYQADDQGTRKLDFWNDRKPMKAAIKAAGPATATPNSTQLCQNFN